MPFDPETAYHGDWQYVDRVKAVTWETQGGEFYTGYKARFGSVASLDISSIAAGLGLTSDAAAIVVWEPKSSDVAADDWTPLFAPQAGDVLRVDSTGVGWIVKDRTHEPMEAKWIVVADKEVVNG